MFYIVKMVRKLLIVLIVLNFLLLDHVVFAFVDKIEGLEFDITKFDDSNIEKFIAKKYNLYELYFQNKTDKTYSIPGYSIDLGVDYSSPQEINSLYSGKSQKKISVLNIAAGAASLAFGGIAKTAANTAMRSVNTFRKKGYGLDESSTFLASNKTYILYPGDGLSLLVLVKKSLVQAPRGLRFICRDEEANYNNILIDNQLQIKNANQEQNDNDLKDTIKDENVIAVPDTNLYN